MPAEFIKHLYPEISGTGVTNANQVNTCDDCEEDQTWKENGSMVKFR